MNIRLHIDRLIVDGLPLTPAQARALRASVEARLADLLVAAPPLAVSGYSVSNLAAAPISLPAGATQSATGERIARSLHAALGGDATAPQRSQRLMHGGARST
ncbi:MAG TPA: hypothetical protein VFI49_14525 [Rudaea sp.]|nr:hypothetical protein [Rudaea sp.]